MKNSVISISILNADNKEKAISKVADAVKKAEDNLKIYTHFDVMDQKFVPNKGIDLDLVKKSSKELVFADVHLMVEYPLEDGYIDKALNLRSRYDYCAL